MLRDILERDRVHLLTEASSQTSVPILMYDKDGKSTVMTLEQLLPMSFGPDKLLPPDQLANGLSQ